MVAFTWMVDSLLERTHNPNVFSDRDIPAPNIDLHRVHCARNLEKCKICGDMVPKKHAEEHFLNTHAPVRTLVFLFFYQSLNCILFD